MERQKQQKVLFGNTNLLSNNAHNKYFNYYVYIKFRSRSGSNRRTFGFCK